MRHQPGLIARMLASLGPAWVMTLAFLFGGVAGGGVYTANYAKATSYLSDDPTACVNCHIMRDVYDSWQNSSHHAVAKCVTCHLPHDFAGKWIAKARSGFNHSWAFTFQDFPEPIRISPHDARLVENNCIDCHQSTVAGMINSHVQNTVSAQERIECVRCHANVGHAGRR